VLLSHHFLFLQQLSPAITVATVFLHSIIRNLVATFNGSPSAQFLSNKSAAEPEKNGEAEHKPKQTQGGGRAGGHTERESREQRKQNTARGTETEQHKKKEQGA
jgi:hypothetical protein